MHFIFVIVTLYVCTVRPLKINEMKAQHSHDDDDTAITTSSHPCWLSFSPPNTVDMEAGVIALMLYGEDTGVSLIFSPTCV